MSKHTEDTDTGKGRDDSETGKQQTVALIRGTPEVGDTHLLAGGGNHTVTRRCDQPPGTDGQEVTDWDTGEFGSGPWLGVITDSTSLSVGDTIEVVNVVEACEHNEHLTKIHIEKV